MMSLAMPAVWVGKSFCKPATRTGTSFPANSICGGRPGLKIKSLTLSEARSISRRTATKFSGGGVVVGRVVEVFGCALLILELFTSPARQNQRQLSPGNYLFARTNYFQGTYIKVFDRE